MKSIRLLVWLFLTACLVTCAENHAAKREATKASPEAIRRDGARPVTPAVIPDAPRPPVVASKGDCAPRAEGEATLVACCNNHPCIGECVESAPGKIECDCYGTRGGCEAGLVCCKYRRACVKPEECEVP